MADLTKSLAAHPLFSGLSPGPLDELARSCRPRSLDHREKLWRVGDPATHFALIQGGLVEIVRQAADGSEFIVALFGPRESVGDAAVLGRDRYPAEAVVASDRADLIFVDAGPVLAALPTQPEVSRALIRTLLSHTRALQEKIAVMSAGSVPKRLALLFLLLADRFGDDLADGTVGIPVVLSRTELARLVGATVETTIRTISRWQKAGWISTDGDGFVLREAERLRDVTRGQD